MRLVNCTVLLLSDHPMIYFFMGIGGIRSHLALMVHFIIYAENI